MNFANIIDFLALIMLIFYAISGFRKGALLAICSMFGIIFAYLGAYLLGPVVGDILISNFSFHKIFAMILGSMIVFFSVTMIFSFIKTIIKNKINKNEEKGIKRSLVSRIAGAMLSSIVGFILISLFVWGYSLARVTVAKEKIPSIHDSITATFTKPVVEETAYMVIDAFTEEGFDARPVAKLISSPGESLKDVQSIVQNEKFQAIMKNEDFMNAFISGDKNQITEDSSFNDLFEDEELRKAMQEIGFLDNDVDIETAKNNLADKMAKMGIKVKDYKDDPEIKGLINELKEDGLLEANKFKELLFDDRFKNLTKKFADIATGE